MGVDTLNAVDLRFTILQKLPPLVLFGGRVGVGGSFRITPHPILPPLEGAGVHIKRLWEINS